jgi:site-specific DNA-methyltransferase (adenine-specific)
MAKREAAAEWTDVGDLVPWEDNPRLNDSAVEKVRESIKRFGFAAPIIARQADGMVIAGHTRLRAAMELGLDKVPVRWMDLDPADARMLALADNKLGEVAEWDDDLLEKVFADLAEDPDLDLSGLGWDEDELEDILGGEAGPDGPDDGEIIEPPEEPDSKPGEVYELGPHRLICGDCFSGQAMALCADASAVVTDPPYGTGISAASGLGNSLIPMDLAGDHDPGLARRAFAHWSGVGQIQVWWGANYYADALPGSPCWLVWDKDHHGMTFADAELAFCSKRAPVRVFRHAWSGNHRASERGVQREHPTQKPVALYVWVLENYVDAGQVVADPFGGSGSLLIAAARTGRTALLVELDPGYCDVIRRRWTTWAEEAGVDPGPGALR